MSSRGTGRRSVGEAGVLGIEWVIYGLGCKGSIATISRAEKSCGMDSWRADGSRASNRRPTASVVGLQVGGPSGAPGGQFSRAAGWQRQRPPRKLRWAVGRRAQRAPANCLIHRRRVSFSGGGSLSVQSGLRSWERCRFRPGRQACWYRFRRAPTRSGAHGPPLLPVLFDAKLCNASVTACTNSLRACDSLRKSPHGSCPSGARIRR